MHGVVGPYEDPASSTFLKSCPAKVMSKHNVRSYGHRKQLPSAGLLYVFSGAEKEQR